jgi:large subunit ribosomal protein L30
MAEKTLTIKLVKSPIESLKNQKATLKALGLHKVGSSVTKVDNVAIRGMIKTVAHLVSVVEA